jgi:hypothetical protein
MGSCNVRSNTPRRVQRRALAYLKILKWGGKGERRDSERDAHAPERKSRPGILKYTGLRSPYLSVRHVRVHVLSRSARVQRRRLGRMEEILQ